MRRGCAAARGRACAATLAVGLWLAGLGAAAAETRTLSFYHTHTGERATITFKRNGRFDEAGVRQMNQFLRDWRRNEVIRMDRALFDLVWEVYQQSGSRQPIHLVSSYRSPTTNNMLRSRSRGVAKESMHTKGRAMDFFLPDVPPDKLRAIGLRKQIGGVGYYGGSGFTHLDTGRIRHWPRMTRDQLARVFPDGKTVHVPSDGKPMPRYAEALAEIQRRGGRDASGTAFASNGGTGDGANVKQGNLLAMLFGGGSDDDEEGTTETPPAAPVKRQPELRQGPLPTATPAKPDPAPVVVAAAPPPAATPATPATPAAPSGRPLELATLPETPATRPAAVAALELPAPPPAAPRQRPAPALATAPTPAVDTAAPAPTDAAPAPVTVAGLAAPTPAPERPSRLAALPPGWTTGPDGVQMPPGAPLAAPAPAAAPARAPQLAAVPDAPLPSARPAPPQALGFAAEPPAATLPALNAPATVARLTPAPGVPLPQARPNTAVAALAPIPPGPVPPLAVAAPQPTAAPAATATPVGRALLPPMPATVAAPPTTTASLPPTQGGALTRGARVGAGPEPLATFTSPLDVAASAQMLDGSTTTRTKKFAQLERPSFESIPALITTPTQTLAKGFGASAPYGAMRTDRFSGTAVAVLAVVVTGK